MGFYDHKCIVQPVLYVAFMQYRESHDKILNIKNIILAQALSIPFSLYV